MTTKLNRAFAFGGISFLVAGGVGIGVETTKGFLFDIRNSIAALEEARAKTLEAVNGLKGTIEMARVTDHVGLMQAEATLAAARQISLATKFGATQQKEGVVSAAVEQSFAENAPMRDFIEPVILRPANRIAQLNTEIDQMKRAIEAHPNAKLVELPSGRIEYVSTLATREAELETLTHTTSKTFGDLAGMFTGALTGAVGEMSTLYPTGKEPASVRRILEEDINGKLK